MNRIHSTAIIGPKVLLGKNNYVGPYCLIDGNTEIGNNNRFEGFCSIGTPPEHKDFIDNKNGKLLIGSDNVFREYSSVNAGTTEKTTINNNILMLKNSIVAHDCIVENNVTLSCNVVIGGHSHIMVGSNFGISSICHQFSLIGSYSMIGMGVVINSNSVIRPGRIYVGSPPKGILVNKVGLNRHSISEDKIVEENFRFENLRQKQLI